jgi:hypothetical protein
MLALLMVATVAHAGWVETDRTDGCVFYKAAETEAGGVQPLRAECDWKVEPAVLQRLLGQVEDHDMYFSGVAKCNLLSESGRKAQTWQLHETPGLSPREVVLDMETVDIEGGQRFTWKKAADQSHNSGAGVEIPLNQGKWEITAGAGGGSHVVYELRYLAGGRVPGLVVRWFQGSGVQALVLELKSYAEKS